jgi:hypothetical protein
MKHLYHRTPYGHDACIELNCTFPIHFELIESEGGLSQYVQVQDKKSLEFKTTPEFYIRSIQSEIDKLQDDFNTILHLVKKSIGSLERFEERLSWLSSSLKEIK